MVEGGSYHGERGSRGEAAVRLVQHEVFPEHDLRFVGADREALEALEEAALQDIALEKRPDRPADDLHRPRGLLSGILLRKQPGVSGHFLQKIVGGAIGVVGDRILQRDHDASRDVHPLVDLARAKIGGSAIEQTLMPIRRPAARRDVLPVVEVLKRDRVDRARVPGKRRNFGGQPG
eukprot:TRINITY_DN19936_c0_g1_i1.p6 TRINITY_DN19936_c0_g1~~TRINITY_DN19936_c0_g1_i1.p6  ORF type:complete len:177 (+),score=10.50 TRINITY_DN19936_c0_g1_i1:2244-2774(+)